MRVTDGVTLTVVRRVLRVLARVEARDGAVASPDVAAACALTFCRVLARLVRDGVVEFLTNWSCSWIDIGDELMGGDLWQPFLDQEAKDEADEAGKVPRPKEVEKPKATKRNLDDVTVGTRRSFRRQGTH